MLESYFFLLLAFTLSAVLGLGVTGFSLKGGKEHYLPFLAAPVGFAIFCLLTIVMSGALGVSTSTSSWLTLFILVGLTAAFLLNHGKFVMSMKSQLPLIALLLGVMMLFGLWSLADQGHELYLGTVNPDLYQSMSFIDSLRRYDMPFFSSANEVLTLQEEPFPSAFPVALQARFGGVVFAQLLGDLFGVNDRASLILMIGMCMMFMPLALYMFCREYLQMEERIAIVAGLMTSIASPYAMSLLHVFIGQNTALAFIPLILSLLVLAIRNMHWRVLVLSILLLNGLFFIYVMMTPYIIAPVAIYAAYKLITGSREQRIWISKAFGLVLLITLCAHITILSSTTTFIRDLLGLLGGMYQSHYYIDFLTEFVLVYGTGVSSYPWVHNTFFTQLGPKAAVFFMVAALIVILLCLVSMAIWARSQKRDQITIFLVTFFIYVAVWFYYTFFKLYGYAPFKMSSWLYFFLIPFLSYLLLYCFDVIRRSSTVGISRKIVPGITFSLVICFCGLNFAASIDYGKKSYGTDQKHGSIISAYGIGGNSKYLEIEEALRTHTEKDQRTSLALPDLISNEWAAYYAHKAERSLSVSSHWLFPDDEAFLPDLETGLVSDVLGKQNKDYRPFFKDGSADYYLLPGNENLNRDIVHDANKQKALWSNGAVKLIDRVNAKDILLTGRGFYRLEYFDDTELAWWFPKEIRWSSEGGEFFHINPSNTNQPFRLSFIAIAGHGIPNENRTIDVYHENKLVSTHTVNGSARVISGEYLPKPGMNTITVRIRERTESLKRQYGLWHLDIPYDWRKLNIAFADATLINESMISTKAGTASSTMSFKELLNASTEFNGFSIDGWAMNTMMFSLPVKNSAKKITLAVFIPGAPEYKFPYDISINTNGVDKSYSFLKPGDHQIELELNNSSNSLGYATIRTSVNQFVKKPGINGQKNLIQSFLLKTVSVN